MVVRGDGGSAGAPLRPSDPTRLGRYGVLRRLGEGGMGTVYLGRSETGRPVAIKVIRVDYARQDEFRTRFRREAVNARRVARFCTAEVVDADLDAALPDLVTEYVEEATLAAAVAAEGPLAAASLERLAVGVAAALTAIHGAGVVHRDLKPSNVLLSPFGPRVIDFGIARAVDATVGVTGELGGVGTPAFMAPEQVLGGPVGPAADVFAWGGVVVFAGTGGYPFGEGPAPVLLYRVVHEPARLAGVDPALAPLVAAALAKDPAERPSATELLMHLLGRAGAATDPRPAVTQTLQGWQPPPPPPPPPPRPPRPPGHPAAGAGRRRDSRHPAPRHAARSRHAPSGRTGPAWRAGRARSLRAFPRITGGRGRVGSRDTARAESTVRPARRRPPPASPVPSARAPPEGAEGDRSGLGGRRRGARRVRPAAP